MDIINIVMASGILKNAAGMVGIAALLMGWVSSLYLTYINIKDFVEEKDIFSIVGVIFGLFLTSLMFLMTGVTYEYAKALY